MRYCLTQFLYRGVTASLANGLFSDRSKNSFASGLIFGAGSAAANLAIRFFANPYLDRLKMPEARALAYLAVTTTPWVISALTMKWIHKKTKNPLFNLNERIATAMTIANNIVSTHNLDIIYDSGYKYVPPSDESFSARLMANCTDPCWFADEFVIRRGLFAGLIDAAFKRDIYQIKPGFVYGAFSALANLVARIALKKYFHGLPPEESKPVAYFLVATAPWLISAIAMKILHKITQKPLFNLNPFAAMASYATNSLLPLHNFDLLPKGLKNKDGEFLLC